ncbi:DUF4288 domain-containing protein [Chryseobacterium sp. TY3]|uniref:DUF4288 domain-containing protein n=2 Tax=Weeksellaceae TaxID=2762318 RepID=A0A1I5BH10_9FLAO|nr:DUF4288 domain-containing protein [Algoriella xinjiangensis]SFN74024.1 protein of unknown function [Algoriella xinjiangensis]
MTTDLKNNIMKKYFGIVLLRTKNETTNNCSFEETYLSIKSQNIDEARTVLEEYGKSCETTYKNQNEDVIVVNFEKIIDVNEFLREETQEKYQELYSRNFQDIESYSKFEKLYSQ